MKPALGGRAERGLDTAKESIASGGLSPQPPGDPSTLLERLSNVRSAGPGRWTATCPAHGTGRNSALSLTVKDGKLLIYCFAGCTADAVLAAVGLTWHDLLAGEARPWRPLPRPGPRRAVPTDERQREWLERLWTEARPITLDDLVAGYLRNRGLALSDYHSSLRYHPALDYFEQDTKTGKAVSRGKYPAMLALVEHLTHGFVALHRTYLTEDGQKAAVPCSKKLAGRGVAGAAIRLYQASERLAVAEGIETALAVHQMTGWPTWATISAGGMERLELPDSIREVLVAADHDPAGLNAARALVRRLLQEGRRVRLAIPPRPGADWLDVLVSKIHGGVP